MATPHTPTSALTALAAVVSAADVLPADCFYPARPVPEPRSGHVVWQSFELPDLLDGRIWRLRAALYVIGPEVNTSTYDVATIDPLVSAVVALFDSDTPTAFYLESGGKAVAHCYPTGGEAVPFQGYYAFRITFDIKIKD